MLLRMSKAKRNCRARRLVALAVISVSGLFAQDLSGTWQGVVTNPDTREELRTVLKIASSDGDPIKGNFYSIDQTFLVFPATLTIKDSVVKLNIPGIGATYQGKLSADGSVLTGTLKGFSIPIQWTMKRVSAEEAWAIPKPPVPTRPMAADANPAFDVVTVKPSDPDAKGRGGRVQGASISMLNMTLTDLVLFAHDVSTHQLIGTPGWSTTERFDITGKADVEGEPNQDQLRIMMRKLLADRFQLAFHREQRELSVYTLNLAKGGAKISKNDGKNQTTGVIFRGAGSVLFNNVTVDDLCKMLQNSGLERVVVNQTGLSGKYDFSLVWTPDTSVTPTPNPNALAPIDKADVPPDLFTATQQQLGLKIDPARLKVEVLVVDKIEKPSAN